MAAELADDLVVRRVEANSAGKDEPESIQILVMVEVVLTSLEKEVLDRDEDDVRPGRSVIVFGKSCCSGFE